MNTFAGLRRTHTHEPEFLPTIPVRRIVLEVLTEPLTWVWLASAAVIIAGLVSMVLMVERNHEIMERNSETARSAIQELHDLRKEVQVLRANVNSEY